MVSLFYSVYVIVKNESSNINEQNVLAALRRRDKDALRELYRAYSPVAFGVICKIVKKEDVAENVLQDVFLKVWNNIEQYDTSKGRFLSWILRIARNAAIDKVRSKNYQQDRKTSGLENSPVSNLAYTGAPSTDNIDVRDKVNKLDTKYRVLIELTYFEGYSHTEAAKQLDLPLGTVKGRIRKALKELRKVLSLLL